MVTSAPCLILAHVEQELERCTAALARVSPTPYDLGSGEAAPPVTVQLQLTFHSLHYRLVYIPFYFNESPWAFLLFPTYVDARQGN